jgi:hypothetical protein
LLKKCTARLLLLLSSLLSSSSQCDTADACLSVSLELYILVQSHLPRKTKNSCNFKSLKAITKLLKLQEISASFNAGMSNFILLHPKLNTCYAVSVSGILVHVYFYRHCSVCVSVVKD